MESAVSILKQAISLVAEEQPYAQLITPYPSDELRSCAFQPDTFVLLYNEEDVVNAGVEQMCNVISGITARLGTPCPELAVPVSQLIH